MLAVICVLTFASCFTLTYTVLSIARRNELRISSRLQGIRDHLEKKGDTELDQPLLSRVIRPMLDYLGKVMMRITPGEMITSLENRITKAEPVESLSQDWVNIQAVLGCLAFR